MTAQMLHPLLNKKSSHGQTLFADGSSGTNLIKLTNYYSPKVQLERQTKGCRARTLDILSPPPNSKGKENIVSRPYFLVSLRVSTLPSAFLVFMITKPFCKPLMRLPLRS